MSIPRLAAVAAGFGWGIACLWSHAAAAAPPVVLADFTRAGHGWHGNAFTSAPRQEDGLSIECRGADPYLEGPSVEVGGGAAWLDIVLVADCPGNAEMRLFFAAAAGPFTEERTAWLVRSPADPRRFTATIGPVEPRMRFRIDPPAVGRVRLVRLEGRRLVPIPLPEPRPPAPCEVGERPLEVVAGPVRVVHARSRWNAWQVDVAGVRMADTDPAETPVIVAGGTSVPLDLSAATTTSRPLPGGFEVVATLETQGPAAARWRFVRRFTPRDDAVQVETMVEATRPQALAHLPWLTLYPGRGSFAANVRQALLPGVEYLENEPSSNERAVRGRAADRRLVAPWKLCLPLAAVAAEDRWLAIAWEDAAGPLSPWFDLPDRTFGSGAGVVGLWEPAVSAGRLEGERTPYEPVRVEAGVPRVFTAVLSGGRGVQVAAAVAAHVRRVGLPPPPDAPPLAAAARLLATGWLDSAAREGRRWRHAVWPGGFEAAVAPDVPCHLLWLSAHVDDATVAGRLEEAAAEAIAALPADHPGGDGIGHALRPTAALVHGNLVARVSQATDRARTLARRLATGSVPYEPGEVDYASTLDPGPCNGFTAITAERMLEEATLTGAEEVIAAALSALDACDRAAPPGVPRGAQPWEMPLHTPDILAAARLVRCQVLGHLLDGRSDRIERARQWAWTGATMTYLQPPPPGPVGRYATIGVLGATHWEAPVWIGQPVQWCGLVYRSALEDLARIDRDEGDTWRRLARGITLAGVGMTFPATDAERRGGLLPDFFILPSQRGDGPAINPGTLQAHLAEAYSAASEYSVTRLASGRLVHVAGDAAVVADDATRTVLTIRGWAPNTVKLLVTRVAGPPSRIAWNDAIVSSEHHAADRVLIVPLSGSGTLAIDWTAESAP